MFRGSVKTVHFVGIGGIGMSGIAEVLLTLGFTVTGSDLKAGAAVKRLRKLGATVHIGHGPDNIGEADVVVRSTAVGEENPEVSEAHRRFVPVIRRAEMLAELMRLKYGIAVAGTHGKTTTTSMLAAVLGAGGLDPTIVIGGRLDSLGGTNARLGTGEFMVAEADESDGSFLYLSPTVALVTNIDPEHLDHYGSEAALEETFLTFANRVPFYGFSVLCQDHPTVQRLIPQVRRRVVTYGMSRQADYRAAELESDGLNTSFAVYHREELLGRVSLGMPGVHNVTNAVGAIATALELDVPFATVKGSLDGFTGVQRRFTVHADVGGVLIVDDYGHHPVEIEATLQAAESGFPGRRLIAVFQPHRYTRVRDLWDGFCGAFNRADEVLVCPIYRAGEEPIEGIDHLRIASEMHDRGHRGVHAIEDLESATSWLAEHVREGDVVITLGAGNVNQVCEELAVRLGSR
ncbi:MAG: UDP-N-acetylmuramate--L-alanine ligase [Deltaproteobacteria bacterium]|nr:MAG: UDP-N-acetylmuramate--L-alanine ligase [Deltaproteobacteria bacterium]